MNNNEKDFQLHGVVSMLKNGWGMVKPCDENYQEIGKGVFFHSNSLEGVKFADLAIGIKVLIKEIFSVGDSFHGGAMDRASGIKIDDSEKRE